MSTEGLRQTAVAILRVAYDAWCWCGAQIEVRFGPTTAQQFVLATAVVLATVAFWASYRVTKFALDRVWWLLSNIVAISLVVFVTFVLAKDNEAALRDFVLRATFAPQ